MPVFRTVSDGITDPLGYGWMKTPPPKSNWLSGSCLNINIKARCLQKGSAHREQVFQELHVNGYRDFSVDTYVKRTLGAPLSFFERPRMVTLAPRSLKDDVYEMTLDLEEKHNQSEKSAIRVVIVATIAWALFIFLLYIYREPGVLI